MKPKETIAAFDAYLDERGLSFEGVIIGGAALALLDVTTRQTKDCDVLAPSIPEEVTKAAEAFADERSSKGEVLDGHWFNAGPGSLTRDGNPMWPDHVRAVLADLTRRLGHES